MGIVYKNNGGFTSKKRYVVGKGFTDSVMPKMKNIGNYIAANKDLIAKPLLGAVGSLGAAALTAGAHQLSKHISNRRKRPPVEQLDAKGMELVDQILAEQPITNIIGSGIKAF